MADSKNAVLICCYCDNPLSCDHCGMEQPADVRDVPVQMADSRMDELGWRQSEEAMRTVIAREIWRYQECPWDFDKPNSMMGELQKQIAVDQAESIRKAVMASTVFKVAFAHTPVQSDVPVAARSTDAVTDAVEHELRISSDHDYRPWAQIKIAIRAALATSPNGWKPGDPETDKAIAERANIKRQIDAATYIGLHKGNYSLRYYLSDEQKRVISNALAAPPVTQWDAESVKCCKGLAPVSECRCEQERKAAGHPPYSRSLTSPAPYGALTGQLERTLSQYDKTIDRATDDKALSDTGRETIINGCIAAKAAVRAFAAALSQLPATEKGREEKA